MRKFGIVRFRSAGYVSLVLHSWSGEVRLYHLTSLLPIALTIRNCDQESGFRMQYIEPDYFSNYPEAIYENGIQCLDQVVLRVEL